MAILDCCQFFIFILFLGVAVLLLVLGGAERLQVLNATV